jgi:tetratricopeptide (TPR) repeat protein
MAVGRWPDVATLYDAELDKLGEEPVAFRRARPASGADLRDAARRHGERHRALPAVLGVEPRTRRRAAPSIGSSVRPSVGRARHRARREAEIAESRTSARVQVPPRAGASEPPQRRARRRSPRTARCSTRRPITDPRVRRSKACSRGREQLEIGEILEPLYQAGGVGEAHRVLEAELAHVTEGATRSRRDVHRLAELSEEQLLAPDAALAVRSCAQGVPGRREDPRRGRAPRLDGPTAAGSSSRTRTPTCSACTRADRAGEHRQASRARLRGGARRRRQGRGDVPLRARRRRPRSSRPSPTSTASTRSLEQYPELAQVLEQRVRARRSPTSWSSSTRASVRSTRSSSNQLDDAIRVFRRIFDELEPTNEPAIARSSASTSQKQRVGRAQGVLRASARERRATTLEAGIRAKIARLLARASATCRTPSRPGSACSSCAARIAEALAGLADLYERTEQWAELTEVLERHYDIAADDESRVGVLLRRAELFSASSSVATTRRSTTTQRVLDIDYGNVQALYAIAEIWRRRNDRASSSRRCTRSSIAARRRSRPRTSSRSTASSATIYQTVLKQPYDAIDAWRKLLEVDPRDFEAMAALERLLRAEERWTEVIDVKMARAAGLRGPRGADPRVRSRSPRSGSTRSARRTRPRPRSSDPRDRSDARRGLLRARELHGAAKRCPSR